MTGLLIWALGLLSTGTIHPQYYVRSEDYLSQVPTINQEEKIYRKERTKDDLRQKIVQYNYDEYGMDQVILMECENQWRDIYKRGDSGAAVGLCQINERFHSVPTGFYDDWKIQSDYCYKKRQGGTPFYGPERKREGVMCMNFAHDNFYFE